MVKLASVIYHITYCQASIMNDFDQNQTKHHSPIGSSCRSCQWSRSPRGPRVWGRYKMGRWRPCRWYSLSPSGTFDKKLKFVFRQSFIYDRQSNIVTFKAANIAKIVKAAPVTMDCESSVFMSMVKHCQRHNGPEGWVHITNLDQTSISESRLSINFKISTKHQHLN